MREEISARGSQNNLYVLLNQLSTNVRPVDREIIDLSVMSLPQGKVTIEESYLISKFTDKPSIFGAHDKTTEYLLQYVVAISEARKNLFYGLGIKDILEYNGMMYDDLPFVYVFVPSKLSLKILNDTRVVETIISSKQLGIYFIAEVDSIDFDNIPLLVKSNVKTIY